MRRADRLFRIVRILRGGRLQTARMLAQKLEVSERTIYRDVSDLQTSGMPIEGEAGVGYTLRRDLDLPPLMFTRDELTALVLGARLVRAWGGAASTVAADQALQRIEAVLAARSSRAAGRDSDVRAGLSDAAAFARAARCAARGLHRPASGGLRLYARGWPEQRTRGTAVGTLLLERRVDAGGVVRAAARTSGRFAWTACRMFGCWTASSSRRRDNGSRTTFAR